MKKIYLNGGLGNQLFQVVFAYKLYNESKEKVVLDEVILKNSLFQRFVLRNTPRTCELRKFSFDMVIYKSSFFKFALDIIMDFILKKIKCSGFIEYEKNVISSSKNKSNYIGFWQNTDSIEYSKYIYFNEDIIDKKNTEIAGKLKNDEKSVAIHVRRGDYLTLAKGVYHDLSPDYYNNIIKCLSGSNFYVFSDDIDWVKDNLKFDGVVNYISHNTGINSYLDMYLMSKCRVNVIANSTFSWWAAVLNKRNDKVVYSPCYWFLNKDSHMNLDGWRVMNDEAVH